MEFILSAEGRRQRESDQPDTRPSDATTFPPGTLGATRSHSWKYRRFLVDIWNPALRLWQSSRRQYRDLGPEGTGVAYALVVSFALIVGFFLGALTMTLLGVSSENALGGEPVRGQKVSTFRR